MEHFSVLILLLSGLAFLISITTCIFAIRMYGKYSAMEVKFEIMEKFSSYIGSRRAEAVEPERTKRPYNRKKIEHHAEKK